MTTYWTRKTAAKQCDVSTKTIDLWRSQGLRSIKRGQAVLIKPEWIDDFLLSEDSENFEAFLDEVAKEFVQ